MFKTGIFYRNMSGEETGYFDSNSGNNCAKN